jgi:hypothetical protein
MSRKQVLLSSLIVILYSTSLMAQFVEMTGRYDTRSVKGGEYTVENNVWGASTAQRVQLDPNGTYFKVTYTEHNNTGGTPASYPFMYKGDHYGSRTAVNNPMPMGVEQISSAPFTWTINTSGASGTWNCAYESWFSDPSAPNPNTYTCELMIWINYSGANPAGAQIGTVAIGGHTWGVFSQIMTSSTSSWNYIAYKISTVTDSVSLDLKDFIHDALSRGIIYTPWKLNNMEAGFEIWSNGIGLTTKSYSASVLDGGVPENYAPVPFLLVTPTDKKSLNSAIIPFTWRTAIDPNLDPVEYIFHLAGPGIDTTIGQIYDTSFTFDGTHTLQSLTNYTWYVEATDGLDTTKCTKPLPRTFRMNAVTGVVSMDQNPIQFFLNQNYPNPFNPSTKIAYTLEANGQVRLSVFDVLGREVAVLVNGVQTAGAHQALFSRRDITSGIYFYKLQAGNHVQIKKMALVK